MNNQIAEYAIIGAGPAGLCAIPNLLNNGVSDKDILWIDPNFRVGEFGTNLSRGSSVPGNTSVESYRVVNKAIYEILPSCAPKNHTFHLDNLEPNIVPLLKIAAEPLQHITHELRQVVNSMAGFVINILTTSEGLKLEIKLPDGQVKFVTTRRAILATGAEPKTLSLPEIHSDIVVIDPTIAFIHSEISEYIQRQAKIKKVAVIGSSHSAALAVMHLLKCGVSVKQFMNKEYKYARPAIAPNGTQYTMYDNTGLKGNVASFTKQLLDDLKANRGEYQGKLTQYIGADRQEIDHLLGSHLSDCSHVVIAIGYKPTFNLHINNIPLSEFKHNNKTTEFIGVKGLFGIGIAFPQEVQAPSGEIESAVGVRKFWLTVNNPEIAEVWRNNSASVVSSRTEVF